MAPLHAPASPSAPATSLEAVKARQQKTWASGDFAVIGSLIHVTAEHLVESADLQAGWRVLDVACGAGQIAIPAARAGARVTGIDIATNSIEKAPHGRTSLHLKWRQRSRPQSASGSLFFLVPQLSDPRCFVPRTCFFLFLAHLFKKFRVLAPINARLNAVSCKSNAPARPNNS